jgi:hypothetical protein
MQRSKFTNAATMRSVVAQAYAKWNRTLSAKRTAARDRTAAAHEKQAPLAAYLPRAKRARPMHRR